LKSPASKLPLQTFEVVSDSFSTSAPVSDPFFTFLPVMVTAAYDVPPMAMATAMSP
jgi:hypothetical protein